MAVIEETIEVHVPLHAAYDQWARFEEFPRFMEGVEEVEQINETTLEWRATDAGSERRWRARIVEQVPDQRITWVVSGGARNDGSVSFGSVGPDSTRVSLLVDVDPLSDVGALGASMGSGDAVGSVRTRVRGDLERFRDLVEARDPAARDRHVAASSDGDTRVAAGGTASPDPGWPGVAGQNVASAESADESEDHGPA
jgi:uncharacterized membrane protein